MHPQPPTDWPDSAQINAAFSFGEGENVRIAIIDSGVDTSHPALAGITLEDDWVIREEDGSAIVEAGTGVDVFGHGTAIASLIRKHAPKAKIGSFRVLSATLGSRNFLIRQGAKLAIDKGYHILNCSFGCRDDQGRFSMLYKEWLDLAYLRRVHVVSACNNDNFNTQEWPGFFQSCVNVNMAAGVKDRLVYRRDHLVEFAAEGVDQELPWINGTMKTVSGSSFAAPVVSALLARLLSVFPDMSIVQAKSILQHHADRWRDDFQHGNVPV